MPLNGFRCVIPQPQLSVFLVGRRKEGRSRVYPLDQVQSAQFRLSIAAIAAVIHPTADPMRTCVPLVSHVLP